MAYIVADVEDHGIQILDMKRLLNNDPKTPKNLTKSDLVSHYTGFRNCHSIIANEKSNTVYCGLTLSNNCEGRLALVDVSDPSKPKGLGYIKTDRRVHDAQCVIYDGPDKKHKGREICVDYDEKQITVVDMTNKTNAVLISQTSYKGVSYTHQGWWTDSTQCFLLLDNETDEGNPGGPASDGYTTT